MRTYIVKRLLLMVPTFIGITAITFSLIRFAPGDYTGLKAGVQGELKAGGLAKEIYEQERKLYGMDKPLPLAYVQWLGKFVTGDFGVSRKDSRPVLTHIKEALPITLILNIISLIVIYTISIPMGLIAAVEKDTRFDRLSSLVLFILYSLPTFWIGLLLLKYLSGGEYLNLFPLGGIESDWAEDFGIFYSILDYLWHLVLPVATLTYGSFAFLSRFSRANLLEVINSQYITTAHAKGLSNKRVLFIHAFRNSLIPLVTLMATLLPGLLGGSVIVESIFSIPGMGKLGLDAILSRDIPVVMAIASISALLTLVGILIADLLYAVIDPRIRLEKRV